MNICLRVSLLVLIGAIGVLRVGAQEEAPAPKIGPDEATVRQLIVDFIQNETGLNGTFDLIDPDTGEILTLKYQSLQTNVKQSGEFYHACVDFKEQNTEATYDLDFDVGDIGEGEFEVLDFYVHKENDQARFDYDEEGNRIPVKEGTKSHWGVLMSDWEPAEDYEEVWEEDEQAPLEESETGIEEEGEEPFYLDEGEEEVMEEMMGEEGELEEPATGTGSPEKEMKGSPINAPQ